MTDVIEMSAWQTEFIGTTKSAAMIHFDFLKIG